MKLSKSVINGLTFDPKKGSQIVFDDALPGFGVRLYASGDKSYVVKYRLNGKQIVDTVAPIHLVSLDAAREKARLFLVKSYEERSAVMSIVKERFFGEFCDEYIERYAKLHKNSWKEDQRRCKVHINPAWQNRRVSSIKRSDVALLLDRIGQTAPIAANRVREQLSKMFECAVLWGYVPEQMKNPARGIPDFRETIRDRWLDETEILHLVRALEEEPNYFARAAIMMLLLTGMRKQECLKLTWEQVDFQKGQLFIPRMSRKNRRPLIVPLSKAAIGILKSTPRHIGNPYVFVGRDRGKPICDLKKVWKRICDKAGLQDAHIHDLRHTVGASLAQNGVDLWLIAKVLGHSEISSTMRYAHHSIGSQKKALDAHGEMLEPILQASISIKEEDFEFRESHSLFGSVSISTSR